MNLRTLLVALALVVSWVVAVLAILKSLSVIVVSEPTLEDMVADTLSWNDYSNASSQTKDDSMNIATETRAAIVEFERQEGVVIVTKIQGPAYFKLLEQSLCLLHYAYNQRVLYDIVVFVTVPITQEQEARLKALVAPANLTLVVDNRGLQEEINALSPIRREKFLERCGNIPQENITWGTECSNTMSATSRISYNWQAEFRSLHIWRHPALEGYRTMLWIDADCFATKVWEQDPVARFLQNDLVILFDNFPRGRTTEGTTVFQDRIWKSFNKTICYNGVRDGHLETKLGGKNNCRKSSVRMIHGFFHITNLDWFRQDVVMNFFENWIGDCFLCREFDDQGAVTIPPSVLAPNRSWGMYKNGIQLDVFHNFRLDGKESRRVGSYLKYWDKVVKHNFTQADGVCRISAGE